MSEVIDAPVADARSPLPAPAGTLEALRAASVAALSEAIGEPPDLTFVAGIGNRGDDLIGAGVRNLLAGRSYREVHEAEAQLEESWDSRKAEGSLEWEEIREATRDAFDRARGRGED